MRLENLFYDLNLREVLESLLADSVRVMSGLEKRVDRMKTTTKDTAINATAVRIDL